MSKLIIMALGLLIFAVPPKTTTERYLFVGDSLTCYTGGWQDQVTKAKGATSTNVSQGGKRTSWMLKTLILHFGSKRNYTKVFIYGGANDAFSYVSLEGAVKNVQNMVDLCNENKMEPIVILGYDPEKVMVKTPYTEEVTKFHRDRYVKLQAMMKSDLVNCRIIDVCPNVTAKNAHDGIHLGASGHKIFADWVLQELNKK